MKKNNGDLTKQQLLEAAEDLFSRNGYEGTGMDAIAKAVGINKASIYYHFRNKRDILDSLIDGLLKDIRERISADSGGLNDLEAKLKFELAYLRKKSKIINLIFMESLKSTDLYETFFRTANMTADEEFTGRYGDISAKPDKNYYSFEFFTGFIPLISYIVFEGKWSEYIGMEKNELEALFINHFIKTHMNNHL